MKTDLGHFTFCTNIFPGESWEEHFDALNKNIPLIKQQLSPKAPFGIGLRLSNKASLKLNEEQTLKKFKKWLKKQDCYIVAINGFPYGNFHGSRVKDQVHSPDWTTKDRLDYTLRLFQILGKLQSNQMEGAVSTSPLSYKHWFAKTVSANVFKTATLNIVEVICFLFQAHKKTGKVLHLDLEPEADGLIESGIEFLDWFQNILIPIGIPVLQEKFNLSEEDAGKAIRNHVRLCYDVCHFSVGFEEAAPVLKKLKQAGIQIGRWQLSAALKAPFSKGEEEKNSILKELEKFNEPVYLHQVVARKADGALLRYPDLPEALASSTARQAVEWRSHFHVPVFLEKYGLLQSTREDILKALELQKKESVCNILEVETYTWEVLPNDLKLPLAESILREMQWVKREL